MKAFTSPVVVSEEHASSAIASRTTLRSTMTQSTIYERNMARRKRTFAMRNDPRAPAIRFLAGMPILCALVPPYTMTPSEDKRSTTTSSVVPSRDGDQSLGPEETTTVFSTDYKPKEADSSSRTASLTTIAISSLVGGLLSEMYRANKALSLSAVRNNTTPSILTSPFTGKSVMLLPSSTVTILPMGLTTRPNYNTAALTVAPRLVLSALPGAWHMSLLFTTQTLLKYKLNHQTDTISAGEHRHLTFGTVIASSLAGGMLSMVRSFERQTASALTSKSFRTRRDAAPLWKGREMVGAAVYFTTYDIVRSVLSREQPHQSYSYIQPSNWVEVGFAGALAGVLYETIVHHPTKLSWSAPHYRALVTRAAPMHAILFLGYETTREVIMYRV